MVAEVFYNDYSSLSGMVFCVWQKYLRLDLGESWK
jgi:hypothetical protein